MPKLDLQKLNSEQKKAVLHGSGPLLILAGAGSGKTNTMTHRIAHLIAERGVSAQNILGLSFTNKASKELKERVRKLITNSAGARAAEGLVVSTFHSLCVRILREFGSRIGYSSNFTIIDSGDQTDTIRSILKNIKVDDRKFDPQWLLFNIGRAKNLMLEGDALNEFLLAQVGPKAAYDLYPIVLQSTYSKYVEQLRAQNAMDFDDLLANTVRLLGHADIRSKLSKRFQHILVDEYQDTNQAQFALLQYLTCEHQNLCVVGDDDQSIYAWRGADPSHILGFKKHYPDAQTLVLSRNYRSTEIILEAANSVIEKNTKRFPKRLVAVRDRGEPIQMITVEDDRSEADTVVRLIRDLIEHQKRPFSDFAILYRSNAQSRIFEEALRLDRIPYKLVGAMSFLDRKEIKDALSYFRLILNHQDDTAFRRIINWPARALGKTTLEKLNQAALAQGKSLWESATDAAIDIPEKTKSTLLGFIHVIQQLRVQLASCATADTPGPVLRAKVAEWAVQMLSTLQFKTAMFEEEDEPKNAERRFESVLEIANAIGMMEIDQPTDLERTPQGLLQSYLTRLSLDSKEEEKEETKNAVTMMTLHGSKGLEYPVVFLVGLEDGYLPHQRSIDGAEDLSEERRLFYVGMTRARDVLLLTKAQNRIRYGKPMPRQPSRFLTDLPPDLILDRTQETKQRDQTELNDKLEALKNLFLRN